MLRFLQNYKKFSKNKEYFNKTDNILRFLRFGIDLAAIERFYEYNWFPPPINPGQVGQSGSVQTQSQTGSVGGKVVNENKPPILNDSKVLHDSQPRKVLTGNHGPLKIPTSGGSARPTFASFRKSTTSTPATSQNQSAEMSKTLRPSFSSIKNQSPSGGESGQAMIGKNRSMPQAQAQTEVKKHESQPQVEQKTTEQTQSSSDVETINQVEEEKSLLESFKEFSSKISKKLDALIARAKELKDSAKAKRLGYDKKINEKFGEALSTKLFTFEEKKLLVNFIKQSSIETDKGLDTVIEYETHTLRNALLKALPGKITDSADKKAFDELKQHGGGGYKDHILRFDSLNSGSTSTYSDIKGTTLKLCDLYKKYVDPQAFPKPEKKTIDTSDLNETEAAMFNFLTRLAEDQSNADLKIFAKILTVGSKLMDFFTSGNSGRFMNEFSKYTSEQLEQAYQIIQGNPELDYVEFKQKCDKEILNGKN